MRRRKNVLDFQISEDTVEDMSDLCLFTNTTTGSKINLY